MTDFWQLTFRFLSLQDSTVQHVVFGSMLLGAAAGALGCFVYLQKKSLLGDTLAHAALPGVALSFLLVQEKSLPLLILGAACTAWLAALSVDLIVSRTRLKLDTALGIVLTVFFALGIVLLTHIQKSGSGGQSGLSSFIFGQAAAISGDDVTLLAVLAVIMAIVLVIGYRPLKLIAFDTQFAAAIGLPATWLQFLLTTMIVLAVTVGLQAVGVVLMAALLITPAAAARQWTDRFPIMIMLASIFGILSGFFGSYISFLAPTLPTGPWVVIVVSAIFAVSVLFAPQRGLISRYVRQLRHRRQIGEDHLLKAMVLHGLERDGSAILYPTQQIAQFRSLPADQLKRPLRRLISRRLIEQVGSMYRLTDAGRTAGQRVIRLHRLWEVYLTRYLDLPGDHVHRDAEDMEHLITPEMEMQLSEFLDHPQYDPHQQPIPYGERKLS